MSWISAVLFPVCLSVNAPRVMYGRTASSGTSSYTGVVCLVDRIEKTPFCRAFMGIILVIRLHRLLHSSDQVGIFFLECRAHERLFVAFWDLNLTSEFV